MLTWILLPENLRKKGIDVKDLEREVIGLILDVEQEHLRQHPRDHRFTPQLKRMIECPDDLFVDVLGIRSAWYHPPSNPGWKPLGNAQVHRYKTPLLEVKWCPRHRGTREKVYR